MRQWRTFKTQASRTAAFAAALGLLLGTVESAWGKIGLSTKFGDIVVEHVEIGETYNLREARQVPFIVKNTGTARMGVVVEVVIPEESKVLPGYEPVPDPTWLRVLPTNLNLQPEENGFCDIILSVPKDEKFRDRHYQADIWAHSSEAGLLGVGVMGRVRFSTGPGPEALKAEKLKKLMYTLDFEMTPDEIYVSDAALGQKIDVKQSLQKSIKVANFAEGKLPLRFMAKPWDSRFRLPAGYEPGTDTSWLSVTPEKVEVEPSSIGQAKLFVHVPQDAANRGKKYAYLVQAGVVDGMDLEVYTRVYIATQN